MEVVLRVSLPIFLLVLCGFWAGRTRILGPASAEALNLYVYYFALPALLFDFVANASIGEVFHWPFIALWAASLGGTGLIAAAIGWWFHRDTLASGTLRTLNAVFSNTGYMGIPLALAAYGEAAVLPAILATVFLTLVTTSLGIALVELDLARHGSETHIARDTLRAIARNPVIWPVLAGIGLAVSETPIPAPFQQFVDLLGGTAGPCALFALGLFVAGQSLRERIPETVTVVLLKLVIHPLVAWLLVTFVLPLQAPWSDMLILLSALPTGATCFVLAQRYGVFVAGTSSITLLSTASSVLTVTVVLVLLRS